MNIPKPFWYAKLGRLIAPTERVSTLVLWAIIGFTVLIAWKGDAVAKGLWAVYLVSP